MCHTKESNLGVRRAQAAGQHVREQAADAAAFCASIIRRAEGTRPSDPVLAPLLTDGEFATPRGNTHGCPAPVQQLSSGVYDARYRGAGAPTERAQTGCFRRRR
jgi:hypothetical protein